MINFQKLFFTFAMVAMALTGTVYADDAQAEPPAEQQDTAEQDPLGE